MGGCFFLLAIMFFLIGLVQLFAPDPTDRLARQRPMPGRMPAPSPVRTQAPAPSQSRMAPPGAASVQTGGSVTMSAPGKLNWIKENSRIYVKHPVKGELMAHVLGKIVFAELWQRERGPQAPWVTTGSTFAAFWLEGNALLLNWQNRIYLLDDRVELSDADIQRDFMPHARKFAQSDQTGDVYFAYPPAMWHIDDIGKFRVESLQGNSLRYQRGGMGRFIHASGDSGRALVVEDFEGGSGQDIAWIGYQINEQDVKQA